MKSNETIRNLYLKKVIKKFQYKYIRSACIYNLERIEVLIYNKNTHFVSVFKDYLIYDYIDEFLKREYNLKEAKDKIKYFAEYYCNYLCFFCKPVFSNLKLNKLVQEHGERRAKLYYNQNYRQGNKEREDEEEDIIDNEDRREGTSKSKIDKTIFNSAIKDIINDNNTTLNDDATNHKENKNNYTISLNNETVITENALLDAYSNNHSIRNIMIHLTKKKKYSTKKNSSALKYQSIPFQMKGKQLLLNHNNLNTQRKNKEILQQEETIHDQINHHQKQKRKSRNIKNSTNCITYDIYNNKKEMTKPKSFEYLMSRITQEVNSNLHCKHVQSPDQKEERIKKDNHKAHNSGSKRNTISKMKKCHSINSIKNSESNHNEEIMKITLELLLNNNKYLKHNSISNLKLNLLLKTIQNVNININNKIQINNNIDVNQLFSSNNFSKKIILQKTVSKDKKPFSKKQIEIQKNDRNNSKRRNEDNRSININNSNAENKNLVLFSSLNKTNGKKHYKSSRNNHQINYHLSQLTNGTKESNSTVTFTSSQLIQVQSKRKIFSKEKNKIQNTHK